jgi:hypothetical protein
MPAFPTIRFGTIRFGRIILAALVLAGCSSEKQAPESSAQSKSESSSSRAATPEQTTPAPTANPASDTVAATSVGPVPSKGMGISRAEIIAAMPDTKFEKGPDIEGQESYTGAGGPATIELIGPEKNLTRASITSIMDLSSDESVRSNGYAFGHFTGIMNPAGNNWLRDNIMSGDHARGFTLDSAFAGRRSHVDFVPLGSDRGRLTLIFEKE